MPHPWSAGEILPPPRVRPWRRILQGAERLAALLGRAPAEEASHALGRLGEEIAYWSLRECGYTIMARNLRLRAPVGEIDIVAVEGTPAVLVFVEVKSRSHESQFAAEDAVDAAKRRQLIRLARAWRRRRHYAGAYRFDMVVVYGPAMPRPRIILHRNAFGEADGLNPPHA
ncbi:MAG: YraN family protein [Terriglobales bacterium]